MNRIFVALLIAVAAAAPLQAEDAKLMVEAAGVRVSKPAVSKESTLWPTGTAVLLQVSSPVGELIRLDPVESTLARYTDGAGNDLLPKIKGAVDLNRIVGINRACLISADRKNCTVEVLSPVNPAFGSKTVNLSGTLAFDCGLNKKETAIEKVVLRSGTKIKGPDNLELALEQAGKPEYGLEPLGFILRSARELDDIAEIKFFKATGVEIPSRRVSTSALSLYGATRIEWSYVLAENVDSATVKIYSWADLKKKKIEFDLKVDLGL